MKAALQERRDAGPLSGGKRTKGSDRPGPFSGRDDRATVLEMIGAGASGYLVKGASDDEVIEITEHAQVEDYDALRRAIAQWRRAGVKLAVDDVGAGFASLRHILRLEPDIIKLDVELVRDIDSDRARRALAKSLITFGQETDATIVAEGIESYQELRVLQDLGVTLGQGYYLARPAPLPLAAAPITALRAG